jgi:tetratricopeptide (TPR) repeat protein
MKKIALLLVLLLYPVFTFACLNVSATNARGDITGFGGSIYEFAYKNLTPDDIAYHESELKKRYSLWEEKRNFDDYSDYGVTLVRLGRYEEAKKVFQEIERLSPGRYSTASNLGTVYELLGDNEKALMWIKKAIELYPDSHERSEWIHVKILEAKIGGDHLITPLFLINTSFGNDTLPKSNLSDDNLRKLRDALYYQLRERISLVKPKDRIVALLLFELGNVVSITDEVNSAMEIYESAAEYGYVSDLMRARKEKFSEMMAIVDNEYNYYEDTTIPWLKYGFLFVIVVAGVVLVVRLVKKS